MADTHIFELARIIRAAGSDPSNITDEVWAAGYRQPERSAEEAAQITIDTFFYCHSLDMPATIWPDSYDGILQHELLKAVLGAGESGSLTEKSKISWLDAFSPTFEGENTTKDAVTIAQRVISAGFRKEASACPANDD